MQKYTVGIYYLDSGGPSCLFGVFLSFGVPRQSNGYNNSRAPACWDLLWGPSSSASIPNECPSSPVGCQLSVPWWNEGGRAPRKPSTPPEARTNGGPLMIHMMAWASRCLGYNTQRGTNNRLVSLDNGWKNKSHRPSFFIGVINSLPCRDASPSSSYSQATPSILSQRFPIVLQTMVSEGSKGPLIWGRFANTRLRTEERFSLRCIKRFHILMAQTIDGWCQKSTVSTRSNASTMKSGGDSASSTQ